MAVSTWYPPTWADAFGVPPMQSVRCPNCRRLVPASMVYRLPALSGAVRAAAKITGAYACDACRETLFRHGYLHPADYAEQVGAPPDVVARARAKYPQGRR